MEVNSDKQDGDKGVEKQSVEATEAPSAVIIETKTNPPRKKRRRGKSKRKLLKPFNKNISWQERKRNDNTKRNNRFRKLVMPKTHAPAPFNNNQFLMEIHKPEPDDFQIRTPSARTRDSSFSIDSEENYFYSLPEDEEEFLTKEFSSVYEDAQSERLSNMSKNDLIQEYLLLEARYENLVKKTERYKSKDRDEEMDAFTDKDSMVTDKDTSTSDAVSISDEPSADDYLKHIKEQEDEITQLKLENIKLLQENEHLRKKNCSSSEDSESDSSSTSISCSSSSSNSSPLRVNGHATEELNGHVISDDNDLTNGLNGNIDEADQEYPLVNGFSHDCPSPTED